MRVWDIKSTEEIYRDIVIIPLVRRRKFGLMRRLCESNCDIVKMEDTSIINYTQIISLLKRMSRFDSSLYLNRRTPSLLSIAIQSTSSSPSPWPQHAL